MAIADEFLFPMTSRASYSSSYPDSDGEFCEPETPVVSRQPSMILDQTPKLDRYNSDPNLAGQDVKSLNSSGIPDYNAPPPNSAITPLSAAKPQVICCCRYKLTRETASIGLSVEYRTLNGYFR